MAENIQNIINFLRNSFPTVEINDMLTWDNTKDYKIPKSKKDSDGIKKWCLKYDIHYIYQGRTAKIDVEKIQQLKSECKGATAIAKEMGIHRDSVYRLLKRVEGDK